MTTTVLEAYLGMIAELERDLYMQEKIQESLNDKLRQYCISPPARTFEGYCRKRLYDPTIPPLPREEAPIKPPEPKREDFQVKDFHESVGIFFLTIVTAIIFPPCAIVVPLVAKHLQNKKREELYKEALKEYTKQSSEYNKYVIKCVVAQQKHKEKEEKNNQYYAAWTKEKEDYKIHNAQNELKRESYKLMLQRVLDAQEQIRNSLWKLYAECNVYHKYRNLAAVCSFYDYIAAGICTKLEGPDGAYNKYDIEMRMDRMITQLDEVIENLHIIQNNQNKLYFEMCDVSRKIDKLQSSINEISSQLSYTIMGLETIYEQGEKQNAQLATIRSQTEKLLESSELNSYLVECNNRQLSYMNRMNYLAGNYDNPYGNYSPV